jgi:hypothetical protein
MRRSIVLLPCQNIVHRKYIEKLSDVKFDQDFGKKLQHLEYQIYTIRFAMTYIFI